MSDSITIHVDLEDDRYDIEIGSGNIGRIGELVRSIQPSLTIVISDRNVEPLYGAAVVASIEGGTDCNALLKVVDPGEATKSIPQANQLWQSLLADGADRSSAVVALGGGVVGDLAGFVAATYARGIPLIQVPTTLLAQVDSSVGGKVGVNLPTAKNMVGAFWQPAAVLIDTDVLSSLPEREYRAGLAEVIKYGVILDEPFFAYLEANVVQITNRDEGVLRRIVSRCCRLKADVVQADAREETGVRAVLNYGHTFCHALEAVTEYGEFLHGEAVSIGMLCASRLAESQGRIGNDVTQRQYDLLASLGLPLEVPAELSRADLLEAMARDKKTERGRLRFILPSRLGCVELVDGVSSDDVLAVMD